MKKILILCCAVFTLCSARAQSPCKCDSTCKLTLYTGGVTGGPFNCGSTIKLKCNANYDFNPHLDCKGTGCATTIIAVTLTDPFNTTPSWATGFIANNGSGSLFVPGGIPPGIYTLTYTYGVSGRKCGTCKFKLNIQCKCKCTLIDSIAINGVNTALKCGDTIPLHCNTKYKFKRRLKCTGDTLTQITAVSVHDGNGNTPSWANPFITNLGNGILNVPNYVSGIFSLTYYWGSNGSLCDSCTYYLKITCGCNCTLSVNYDGPGGFGSPHCGDTIKATCGTSVYITRTLTCDSSGAAQLIGFSLTDAANNTPSWAASYTGTGPLAIPTGVNGIFTLTYTWGGADGTPCGSCKILLDITCCPKIPCTLNTTIIHSPKGILQNLHCGDTTLVVCGNNYNITPSLNCSDSTISQISTVTIHDAGGNTPSWAAAFLSNSGTGTLSIPINVNGYYTLTYYWGVNGTICDSCKYILKAICCPDVPCAFTATVSRKGIPAVTVHCAETLQFSCHSNYSFAPHLSCSGDTATHITGVTLTDAFNNTPSWAAAFLANAGSGVLAIPSMQSGIYTLTYNWGVGTLQCGSCKIYLRITCCDSVKVSAGPDLTVCCTSYGVQLNATPNGGVAPYTYSWSPITGLSNPNIANPVAHSPGTYIVTVTDAFGCMATDTVKIIYSGVNCCRIINNKSRAQAYPNPFTNGFTLKIPANTIADVQVIDLHGMTLERQLKANGSVQMGKKLAYGIYTIVITYNDGTKEQIKIIKNSR